MAIKLLLSGALRVFHNRRFHENGKMRFPQIQFPQMHYSKKSIGWPNLTIKNQNAENVGGRIPFGKSLFVKNM